MQTTAMMQWLLNEAVLRVAVYVALKLAIYAVSWWVVMASMFLVFGAASRFGVIKSMRPAVDLPFFRRSHSAVADWAMFVEELTRSAHSSTLAMSQIAVGREDSADFEEWRTEIWETLLQNALSHLGLADENWHSTSTYYSNDSSASSSRWWSRCSWRWFDLKEVLWDVGRMVESLVTCLTLLVPCAFLVTFLLIVGTGYVVYLAAMELVDMYHLGRAYISLLSSWISSVCSDVRKSNALDVRADVGAAMHTMTSSWFFKFHCIGRMAAAVIQHFLSVLRPLHNNPDEQQHHQLALIPFQRSSSSERSYHHPHQQDRDQDHLIIPPYNPDEPSPPTTPEGSHVLLFRVEIAMAASVFDWRRRHALFCDEFSLPASRFGSNRRRSAAGAHNSGVNCRSSPSPSPSPSSFSSPSPSTSTQLTTPVPAAARATPTPTAISASNVQQVSSSAQSSPSVGGVTVVTGAGTTPSPAPAPTTSTSNIQACGAAVIPPKVSPISTSRAGMPTTPIRPEDKKTSLGAPAPTTTTPAHPALQPIPPKSPTAPLFPPSVASSTTPPTATTTPGAPVRAAAVEPPPPSAAPPANKRVRRIIHFVSRPAAPQGTPIQTTSAATLAPRTSTSTSASSTTPLLVPKPLESTIPQTVRQVQKLDGKPINEALDATVAVAGGGGGGAN
ncbi:hypothetical protein Pelo_7693 [Pelomyxa schiedti]|nr:hypothetical protein Pelo_7693 [Pelomyxa schiedti]